MRSGTRRSMWRCLDAASQYSAALARLRSWPGRRQALLSPIWQGKAAHKLIDAARFETDPQKYKEELLGFIEIAFAETPRILLFQPYLDVAMQKNVTGYRYWFHRQLDYRQLAKM
jgi:ABC-type transport system substrate-binding protein